MVRRKKERQVIIQKKKGRGHLHPTGARTPSLSATQTGFFISLFLVVVTLIIFFPLRSFQFINLDDEDYVTENPQVLNGLSFKGVIWAFTTMHSSNWHPLTWLSHMLDIELYGLNPGGHHVTNLLLHLANILLLFWVLKRMTGTLWRSGFIALLFALHPLHVESVAWVAERKDVLSTLFWILTMGAYVHYVHQANLKRYLLVFFFFALGLMSKPMLVTLPFVLLLLDYWPLGRLHWPLGKHSLGKTSGNSDKGRLRGFRLVLEKVPLLILVAVSCSLTLWAQRGTIALLEALPMGTRMANALTSYVSYIGKMIWPCRLAVQYPYPDRFPLWQVVGAGLFLVGVSIWVVREVRRRPYLGVGWFWYLGTLVPVIGLVQVGAQAMADRYTYVPLIGIFIMVVWGVSESLVQWRYRRITLSLSAALILAILMVFTRTQLLYWHDSIALYKHTLNSTANNYQVHYNLGLALAKEGKNKEAIAHYQQALRIRPDYYKAHTSLGIILARQGSYEEAIVHYNEAIRINPEYADAHYNLGFAFLRQGKHSESIARFEEAIRINPNDADAYNHMGLALARQGLHQEAITQYHKALRIKPNHIDAHNNLGIVLVRQGKYQEAITHFTEVLHIKPHHTEVHYNLGLALAEQGKYREAIYNYSQALRIKPDFDQARFSLGLAYWMIGDRGSALEELRILKMNNPDLASTLSQKFLK
jgi:tetratricopeptide (TPR) repeat protein